MQAIWQAVHTHVLGPHVPLATLETSATVLGAIARLRLAPLPPGFHAFWGLPVLDQPPSQPLLGFIADALNSGMQFGPLRKGAGSCLRVAIRWCLFP